MTISKTLSIELLRGMKRIRLVEEGIAERYPQGKMRCPMHLSIGQEAAAIGVGLALKHSDLAVSTHRAHAHYLSKGGNLKAMLAEIYGKATGCSSGRGGSMHLIDTKVGFMGSTAIVGNSMPVGVGLALSLQLRKSSAVSTVFCGDGSLEEGAFYESANFAAVRNLPVLFVCENNLYSVYSHLRVRQPKGRKIHKMVEAIGIPASLVDGNDPQAVYEAALAGLDHIRDGKGPFFLELTTYRWREHCGPNYDNDIGYRTEEEFQEWKRKDPIPLFEEKLLTEYVLDQVAIKRMDNEIQAEIRAAFDFAEISPFPEPARAFEGIFAEKAGSND
jgi:TPP-dependent pyruvate/acetoin dehydrogenase alpha subunit